MYNIPHTFLHESTKDDISVRLRPWYYVSLIVLSMAHDVFGNVRCSRQKDLASGWIAFCVLDASKDTRSIASTVEHDFCRRIRES